MAAGMAMVGLFSSAGLSARAMARVPLWMPISMAMAMAWRRLSLSSLGTQ
jgi:hypothetical protein